MSEICKPCPHFPGYYYGFQYSNVTCPLCLSESRIAALEAHAKAFEARCLALSQERAALEARNAEQFRLMGQYMENAEAAHERADALEARCRELEGLLSRVNNCRGADFKRIADLEAALKLVACNCNGEAGCKSYELYYKLCPAPETVAKPYPHVGKVGELFTEHIKHCPACQEHQRKLEAKVNYGTEEHPCYVPPPSAK
jgi:hypothetical protein